MTCRSQSGARWRIMPSLLRAGASTVALAVAGCASYRALPLPEHPNLAPELSRLDLTVPAQAQDQPATKIDPAKPVTPDQVALLAMVNTPDLAALRGKIAVADAQVLAAQILPNPSIGLGYAFYLGGPAFANAKSASLGQDIRSFITYTPRVASAKAQARQVAADALWDEWQVAQKARLLAIAINSDEREIDLRTREYGLLSSELRDVEQATRAGNLDLTAEAPLIAATASAQRDLTAAKLQLTKDWEDLNALLGLEPEVRFTIAAPEPATLPENIDQLLANVADRRPDLVALRYGYEAADEGVREAILGQFPAFNLGVTWGSDTSDVRSSGPQLSFDLPIFDRNQGKVATTEATRQQLHAEYQTRLDDAEGTARGLLTRARIAQSNLEAARRDAATAGQLLDAAEAAYHDGNIDQRALADYQTTALDRQLDVLGYERTLQENSLGLSVELGLGFPRTIFSTAERETNS
jgi:outer membrane protein TolC